MESRSLNAFPEHAGGAPISRETVAMLYANGYQTFRVRLRQVLSPLLSDVEVCEISEMHLYELPMTHQKPERDFEPLTMYRRNSEEMRRRLFGDIQKDAS